MWSHLILLMRAKRALRAGRFESALGVLEDPLVRDDRRGRELREDVLRALEQRGRERQERGHVGLALADARRLAELDPERVGLREWLARLESAEQRDEAQRQQRERQLESFERALAEGRLHEARDLLQAPDCPFDAGERSGLAARLDERRRLASRALQRARGAVDRGLPRDAREAFDEARRLCSDSLTFRERLVGLSASWARERFEEVQAALDAGRPFDAAHALAEWIRSEPESEDLAEAQDLLLSVGERLAAAIREAARKGDFAEALAMACRLPRPFQKISALRLLRDRVERVQALREDRRMDPRQRAEGLRRLRRETGWEVLDEELKEADADAHEVDGAIAKAGKLLEAGRIDEGRETLDRVLDRWPGAEEARGLLDGLIEDERDRRERLEAAREAMRAGRLREAQRQLLRLVGGGYGADTARGLLRDIGRLQKKLARELSACRARLEAGADGPTLLRSLDKLRQIQSDSPELEDLQALVLRRKAQHERIELIRRALRERRAGDLLESLRSCFEEEHFDADDREDRSRFTALGTELDEALQAELGRGDALFVHDVARGLEIFSPGLGTDFAPLVAAAKERIEFARARAQEGLAALEAKQATRAETCLGEARGACASEPTVLRLAHRMRRLAGSEQDLRAALEMVDSDREGARERLEGLGPTPRPLMSLAFAVRDKLQRSGDFERGCRLEVEDAGEFLLFTEDRLRIGNASGTSYPQIPVLARIRAQHATLTRSVSFHGGVTHEVEADADAPTLLNGRPVQKATLQHGDELLLGDVLPVSFRRPNPRSVSTLLRLGRGFEAHGASRILWVKQGGRDGRVLIGRGKDVHVRVRVAEPELFLWAPGPGRLAVCFAGLGEFEGQRFTGEHELRPGCRVRCGEIVFRVLPL